MRWKLVPDNVDGYSFQLRHREFRVVVYSNVKTYTVVVFANNPESSCWFSQIVETFAAAMYLGEDKFREFKKPYDG